MMSQDRCMSLSAPVLREAALYLTDSQGQLRSLFRHAPENYIPEKLKHTVGVPRGIKLCALEFNSSNPILETEMIFQEQVGK